MKYIKKLILEDINPYNKYMSKIREEQLRFFESLKTFKDIKKSDVPKIIDMLGHEGYNDEEEAIYDLEDKIKEWNKLNDPCILYRIVSSETIENINKEEPGEHWTMYDWNLDGDLINSIEDDTWEDNPLFVIEAKVPLSEIDIKQTIIQNLSFPNEHEINVKDNGRNVEIIKIYELE
jgi:hypothetical protein